jgi:hypothetical protein
MSFIPNKQKITKKKRKRKQPQRLAEMRGTKELS